MSVLEMEGKRIFKMVQTNERKSSTYRHIFHPNTSLTGQNGQNSHFKGIARVGEDKNCLLKKWCLVFCQNYFVALSMHAVPCYAPLILGRECSSPLH